MFFQKKIAVTRQQPLTLLTLFSPVFIHHKLPNQRQVIKQSDTESDDRAQMNIDPEDLKMLSERTVRASQVFIGTAPILLVYPFLQRYFVKGIVLGAVKE